jgi:hypothetical protein
MARRLNVEPPAGAVGLAAGIAALRDELFAAWWDAQQRTLRFKPSPVELTMQVAATADKSARAGVRWWLIELGADVSHELKATQTVKFSLEPILFDANGNPKEFLVDALEQLGANPDDDLDASE